MSSDSQIIAKRRSKHRAEMPLQYRKLFDRVMAGLASPREAIKLQCLACWAFVRAETQRCDNYTCQLYCYRPYQKPAKSPTERLEQANADEKRAEG